MCAACSCSSPISCSTGATARTTSGSDTKTVASTMPGIEKITWILCACAFLTNVSYWLQSYAGSFGSAGWAGRFGAICGHGMSIRSTWTCSVFRSGKVVSGAAIGCTGS